MSVWDETEQLALKLGFCPRVMLPRGKCERGRLSDPVWKSAEITGDS